jgi:hypothetical protein
MNTTASLRKVANFHAQARILMYKLLSLLSFLLAAYAINAQSDQPFTGNETVTWQEAVEIYQELAFEHYEDATFEVIGSTDVGKPLHMFVIHKGAGGQLEEEHTKPVLFINNGIHPGEPCGVDASIKLARNLLSGDQRYNQLLDSVIVAMIPIYNVGGALNRGCCVRANQNGPEEYGFRGNARNLDLNRDFIKLDSYNAQAFTAAYHALRPEVMVDTHTSNGADYQYVMTMIATQPDKAGEEIGNYIREKMNPALYAEMDNRGFGMTPYVFTLGRTPDEGIRDYLETPRYSTGYAALFNTIGYTSETHMLKPFAQRVESTYQFLLSTLEYMHANATELVELKQRADAKVAAQKTFDLQWELDTTQWREIPFKGFEAGYKPSKIHGEDRLYYDRKKPFEKKIRYYDHYVATRTVEAPEAYVIPQAWREVVYRLDLNGVEAVEVQQDTIVELSVYYIRDFKSSPRVYEGHHLNTVTKLDKVVEEVQLFKGDLMVYVDQPRNRYIVETLEPEGADAFFVWNFFDSAMQQKEWYSDYVFEDTAARLLKEDKSLREAFDAAKAADAELAGSPRMQLYWIYTHSPYFEGTVNRYPVFRME